MTAGGIGARRPVLTLAMAGAVTALALLGVSRLRIETSLGAMFDPDRPSVRATETIGERFAAGHELLIVLWSDAAGAAPPAETPDADDADRLAAALRAADPGRTLIRDIRIDRAGAWGAPIARALAPAALYYTDDTGFEEALRRLQPEQMRARLDRLETLLAAPGGLAAAAAEEAGADPLGIRELVARAGPLAELAGAPPAMGAAARPTLVRIAPAAAATDVRASEALVELAGSAIEQAGVSDAELTGAPAVAAYAARSIRGDMQRAIISSALLIQIVFLLAYRRPLTLLVVSAPAVLGLVWAFGALGFAATELTALTAAIGGALAGLGVDYAIHLASASSGAEGGRRVAPAIMCAAATSVLGFCALAFSGLAVLRGLALIGALGLAGATVATLWAGPALLRLSRGAAARDAPARAIVAGVGRHPRLWIAVALAAGAAGALGAGARTLGDDPWLEAGAEVVHPSPNPPLRTQERLAEIGLATSTLPVLVEAPRGDLLERCRAVDAALRAAGAADGLVAGAIGPHTLIPEAAVSAERARRLGALDADAVARAFRDAVADSALAPAAFEGYEEFLRQLVTAPAPTLDAFGAEAAAAGLLPDTGPPDAGLVLVRLSRSPRTTTERGAIVGAIRAALAPIPEATLAGPVTIGADAFALLGRDLPRLAALGGGLALLWLAIFFRRAADVALAAAPALFAAVALLGVMSALGWRFNILNMAALPLLAGVGVDDGVFLVAASRDRAGRLLHRSALIARLGSSAHAITVTTMTTSLAFGSLVTTSVPGIRSLGLLVGAGALAALLGAVALLVPLLILRAPRDGTPAGASAPVEPSS